MTDYFNAEDFLETERLVPVTIKKSLPDIAILVCNSRLDLSVAITV